MPTGARLVSAIFFGALAYYFAVLVHHAIEADTGTAVKVGAMPLVFTLVGVLVGWRVMGKRAGEGTSYAVQGGILSSVSIAVWVIVIFAVREMIQQSMKLKYKDAPAAVVDAFRIAIDDVTKYSNVQIVALLLIGGIVGGYVAEFISHRWR